jgi:hypothetical protein
MLLPTHYQEWFDSAIASDVINLNVKSLKGFEPYDYLLYALPDSDRRNDGRIRDKILKRYRHIEEGGWWASGVDVLTGEDSYWGQFKSDVPYQYQEKKPAGFDPRSTAKNKKIKYEGPKGVPTEIFALKISFYRSWQLIKEKNETAKKLWLQRFQQKIAEIIDESSPASRTLGSELQRTRRMDSKSALRRPRTRPTTPTSRGQDEIQSVPTPSLSELQTACERREYAEIDRIFRTIWDLALNSPKQFRKLNFRGIERLIQAEDRGFWPWVIDSPEIHLIISEGAKKVGALITANYIAIALPGVYNGYRQPKTDWGQKIGNPTLIPQLRAFAQKGREIIFCFDQDRKAKTVQTVRTAIANTGKLFEQFGCKVSVINWLYPEKGVDDLIAARGKDCFDELYKERIYLRKFRLNTLVDLSKYSPIILNERYLGENLVPPDEAQLIGLRSPKGSGKTEWLSLLVAGAIRRGQRVIIICHREQLAIALANRFGIDYRTELRTSITKGLLGYALCVDSLHPEANPPFRPEEWSGALVVIDEVEQVLWHMLDSNTCANNRIAIIDSFKQLLLTAVGMNGKVYLADADLSPIALDYIRSLIGFPVQTWVVDNQFKKEQKRRLVTYSGNNPKEVITALVKAIETGEKTITHLTGQKSKSLWGTINLELFLLRKFPELKILRIDSESVADPGHQAYGCMGNLNAILPLYDAVICSPVIETGVSIDVKHFDSVWAIAQGVQTVDAVCQTLERVRDNVTRHLWVKTTAKGNRIGNGSVSVKGLLTSTHKLARANISLLQQAGINDFDELEVNYSPESLNTWARRACIVNAGKNNYRAEIIEKLVAEGYEISNAAPDEEQSILTNKNLQDTRTENYQRYTETVPLADTPTDSELDTLINKKAKTQEERYKERKGILSKRYGIEVTPELVVKDDNGWYSQLQLHYYLTIGNFYLVERDRQKLSQQQKQGNGRVFKPDLNRGIYSAKIKALKLLDIEQFLDPNAEFSQDSLTSWFDKVMLFRFEIQSILGVAINPDKDSPIAIAQRILKKLGSKLEFKHQIRIQGKPTRIYTGCQLNSDHRNLVFDNWVKRDFPQFAVTANSNVDLMR